MKKGPPPPTGEAASITMPPPRSPEERLQAKVDALGMNDGDHHQVKVASVDRNPDGTKRVVMEVTVELPAERIEEFLRRVRIRPFTPEKDTVPLFGGEAKLLAIREVPEEDRPGPRLWTAVEAEKRTKPKGKDPDLP